MVSDRQIAELAGFYFDPGNINTAVRATAIALAESGGNEQAHNPTPPDDSYGLWQINMYGSLGPNRRRKYGLTSNSELFNPNTNAKVAGDIYRTQGWGAWSVYSNGTYENFIDRATKAATEPEPVTGSVSDLSLSERLSDAAGLLNPAAAFQVLIEPVQKVLATVLDTAAWLGDPNNWLRIIQVSGGVVLGVVAMNIVLRPVIEKNLPKGVI